MERSRAERCEKFYVWFSCLFPMNAKIFNDPTLRTLSKFCGMEEVILW